jgi:hypothetical protein
MTPFRRNLVRIIVLALFALATGFGAISTAEAVSFTVDSVGDSFTTNWSLDISGINGAPAGTILSGTASWTVSAFSSSSVTIGVNITNTTAAPLSGHTGHILGIGLYTSPDATAAFSSTGTYFDGLGQGVNFPGGFNSVDVCVYSAQNCQGGNINLGLGEGVSDSFSLLFTNPSTGSFSGGLALDTFAVKFQGDYGSFEFPANGNGRVSEPSPLLLLGAVLLVFGFFGRRLHPKRC